MRDENKRFGILCGLLGGTLSITISNLAVKILGLVYKIPMSHLLGDLGMGYFNSAYTVFGFFYVICMAGVPKAVMILVSEAKGKGDRSLEGQIFLVAKRIFLLIGTVIAALFIVLSSPLASFIGSPGSGFTMIMIAPSLLFVSLSGVLRGYLSANLRFSDIAVSGLIEALSKLIFGLALAICAIKLSLDLKAVTGFAIFGVTIGSVLSFLYLFIRAKSLKQEDKAGQYIFSKEKSTLIKRLLLIAVPITLSSAVMSLSGIIDLSTIMKSLLSIGFSEDEAAAMYGNYTTLAVPMLNFALSIITPISIVFLPSLTRAYSVGDTEEFKNITSRALSISAFLGAPMTFGFMLFSEEILGLIFGESSTAVGAGLLTLLSPSVFFASILVIINTALEGSGNFRGPIYSMLFGALCKFFVGTYLLREGTLGISGAPIGTVILYGSALLFSLIYSYLKARISFPLFSAVFRYLFFGAVATFSSKALCINAFPGATDLELVFFGILFSGIFYLLLNVFFVLVVQRLFKSVAKYTKFA